MCTMSSVCGAPSASFVRARLMSNWSKVRHALLAPADAELCVCCAYNTQYVRVCAYDINAYLRAFVTSMPTMYWVVCGDGKTGLADQFLDKIWSSTEHCIHTHTYTHSFVANAFNHTDAHSQVYREVCWWWSSYFSWIAIALWRSNHANRCERIVINIDSNDY